MGDSNPRTVPTKVTALDGKTVTAVSAGTNHTCAIADGKVYCWGQGTSGQLGNGTNNTAYSPVLVSNQSGSTATAISAGGGHTCAISDGSVFCWGANSHGQLGNDSTTNANAPVAVSTSSDLGSQSVTSIAAGGSHSCAVGADHRAYCWGYDADGQLGSQYTYTYRCWLFFTCTATDMRDRTTPAAVDTSGAMGTRNVASISAGSSHTCAVAGGAAYCWGLGTSGQLGNSSTGSTYLSRAVTTSTMSATVSAVSAGANSACAIAGGAAYCWGAGTAGQLGNAASTNRSAPVAVAENGAMKAGTVTLDRLGYVARLRGVGRTRVLLGQRRQRTPGQSRHHQLQLPGAGHDRRALRRVHTDGRRHLLAEERHHLLLPNQLHPRRYDEDDRRLDGHQDELVRRGRTNWSAR